MSLCDVWITVFATDHRGNRPAVADPMTTFYMKQARRACGLILSASGAINARFLRPYETTSDALGMMDAITTKHTKQTASSRFKCLFKLFSTKKNNAETWEEFINRVDIGLNGTARLIPNTLTTDKLLSEFALFILLMNIDTSDATRRSLLGDDKASWSNAKNLIINQENTSPGQIMASNGSTGPIFAVANAASSSNLPLDVALKVAFADRVNSNMICERKGHAIRSCHEYAKAKEAELASRRKAGSRAQPQPPSTPGLILQTDPSSGPIRNKGKKSTSRHKNNGFMAEANSAETDIPVEFAGNVSTIRSPENDAVPDGWTADSGASCSMSPRREWLITDMTPDRHAVKLADGSIIWSAGRGVVTFVPVVNGQTFKSVLFTNVLYVPDLSHNLLSLTHLTKRQHFEMNMDDTRMTFMLNNAVSFTTTINDRNIAYADGQTVVHSQPVEALAAVPLSTWHNHMFHVGFGRIQKLIGSDAARSGVECHHSPPLHSAQWVVWYH